MIMNGANKLECFVTLIFSSVVLCDALAYWAH